MAPIEAPTNRLPQAHELGVHPQPKPLHPQVCRQSHQPAPRPTNLGPGHPYQP
jgi:hypothetical protein